MNCICGNKARAKGLCATCYSRKWRKENPNKYRDGIDKWYANNRKHAIEYAKQYKKNNPHIVEKCKRNFSKEKLKEYYNNRYKNDLQFKLKVIIRNRLRSALKQNQKKGKTLDLLGCSLSDFKEHIESLWQPGMNWDNHGRKGWHLDHITPLSEFNLSDPEQLRKACNYTNIQPLWWLDNLSKNKK